VARWPRFLADGRIAVTESSPAGALIRVFDRRGRAERTIPLHSRNVTLGGEIAPGRLVAALGDEGREKWRTSIVDLDSGTVRPVAEGLVPTALLGASYAPNAFPEAGSDATRLFTRDGREIVRLDPSTGQLRVIVRAIAPKR